MTTYCIYRILCIPNGKSYVGQTGNLERRKDDHFAALRLNKHHSIKLQRAYHKYGRDSFQFEVLQTGISEQDIDRTEIAWIECFDSYKNGYNGTLGGDNPPEYKRPITWNEKQYPSVSAAARAIGVTREAMNARIMKGHRSDSTVQGEHHQVSVTYNGVQYLSITLAAKALGLSISAMRKRIRIKKYTSDADMPGNIGAKTAVACSWNGISYRSYNNAAKALGISAVSLKKRLRKGYTCDADMPFRRK